MKTTLLIIILAIAAVPALALEFDQNVTPDVIFGSGNANGSFTVDRQGSIEVGLRGKLRFDSSNQPQNVFNSDGNGGYEFVAGPAPGGFSWNPGSPTTPVWNFEFSVNVNYDDAGAASLDDYTYELGLDFDPDPSGTNFLVFDPITPTVDVPFFDHSIGFNTTTSSTDFIATDASTYALYLAAYNAAQNSWSYEFFNDGPFAGFDPNDVGVYDIYLKVLDGGTEVASTTISIAIGGAVATEANTWGQLKSLYR